MTSLVIAYTQACEDRDFVEWHQGCPWCAVWVVRLEATDVATMMQKARHSMRGYVLPRYARQAHITLAYRGLMAVDPQHGPASFTAADLQRDIASLQAAQLQPFSVCLQGVGSFSTVPYLAVASHQHLQSIHRSLAAGASYAGWEYVPHVTVGHYAVEAPVEEALAPMRQVIGDAPWWADQVHSLWLARYRTHDIAGPLFFEGHFDLRTGQYKAQPGALWP